MLEQEGENQATTGSVTRGPHTARPYSECEEALANQPLRQGDILEWPVISTEHPAPWRQFGVVITADCDIAMEKHDGLLSYVPILPLPDYLRLFYLPKMISRALDPVWRNLLSLV